MHRHSPNYAGDSESLQADVMRFMAIIAFCLIAILALVKNTEPAEPAMPAPEPTTVAQVEEPAVEPSVPEKPAAEPEPATVLPESIEPDPVEPQPVIAALERPAAGEEPVIEPPPAPIAATPAPEAPAEESVDEPSDTPVVASENAPPTPDSKEEGLTLRFASDGDFLRLIARGDIRVYAFQESDVLALNESYRFLDTAAPGQVYELLPPSIPGLIVDALKQARPDSNGYRWGIALPGRISHQIEQHLSQVRSGELVIDRYGDVHHVAAS